MNRTSLRFVVFIVVLNIVLVGITITGAVEREACGTRAGSYTVAGDNRPDNLPNQMRVYPLHVGDTLVPYEQFYGGTTLSGLGGTLQLLNSDRFLWVPIYMFLVDHPVVGPFVIDTAVNAEMVYNYEEYFSGNAGAVSRLLGEEYRLQSDQEVTAQLAQFGYTPDDIELVVLTHSHDDHVGGLPYFQDARIVLSEVEFEIVEFVTETSGLPVNTRFYEGVTCWEPVSFSDGTFHDFESSQDLFGDGSVILIPTPGHSEGSLSVIMNMGDYHLLLPGDSVYTMRHLDPTQVSQFIPDTDPAVMIGSIEQLNGLRAALEDVIVVPSHDHTGYIETVLPSLVTCGFLSEIERERVTIYEQVLFDDNGQVSADFLPVYIPDENGTKYGRVSGIDMPLDELPVCEPS